MNIFPRRALSPTCTFTWRWNTYNHQVFPIYRYIVGCLWSILITCVERFSSPHFLLYCFHAFQHLPLRPSLLSSDYPGAFPINSLLTYGAVSGQTPIFFLYRLFCSLCIFLFHVFVCQPHFTFMLLYSGAPFSTRF